MLNQTKHWVKDLKDVGFERNEFSCQTPQEGQGWGRTKIRIRELEIRENDKNTYDYMRSKIDGLLDLGLSVIESKIGDRYYYHIYNEYDQTPKFQVRHHNQLTIIKEVER